MFYEWKGVLANMEPMTISKLTNVQISDDQRIDEYYCENNDIRNEFNVDVDPLKDAHHINGIDWIE